MLHGAQHATDRRRVLDLTAAVELVQAETDQGRFLLLRTPDRATDLGDLQFCHHPPALFADFSFGALTATENFAHLLAATAGHRPGRAALHEGIQSRFNHGMPVRRTERFADDVMNPERFADRTNRATGDNTGTSI